MFNIFVFFTKLCNHRWHRCLIGTKQNVTIRTATAASAIAVSKKGASTSIPFYKDVRAVLPSMKTKNKYDSLNDKIEQYLKAHIKNANLKDLSDVLGYSEAYTGRLVQRVTGLPFSKLLQDRRCALANELLNETEMSVEEIIAAVGYENGSFFRAIFKSKYGISPSQYKKQMKREKQNFSRSLLTVMLFQHTNHRHSGRLSRHTGLSSLQ